MKNRSYLEINLIFIVFLAFFFGYSLIFSALADNHPIPSFYTEITGEETISSGLSRSFSDIIRGNFKSANEYNIYGIRVLFFLYLYCSSSQVCYPPGFNYKHSSFRILFLAFYSMAGICSM
jgi:hypothetical protein